MAAILNFIKMSREKFLDRHYAASDFYNRMFSGDLCVLASSPFSFLAAYLDRLLDRASLLPAGIAIVGIKS